VPLNNFLKGAVQNSTPLTYIKRGTFPKISTENDQGQSPSLIKEAAMTDDITIKVTYIDAYAGMFDPALFSENNDAAKKIIKIPATIS
jgi:hypothetical protein